MRKSEISKWDNETDVLVVGYGYAGGVAAIDVHDAGGKVILFRYQTRHINRILFHYSLTPNISNSFWLPLLAISMPLVIMVSNPATLMSLPPRPPTKLTTFGLFSSGYNAALTSEHTGPPGPPNSCLPC